MLKVLSSTLRRGTGVILSHSLLLIAEFVSVPACLAPNKLWPQVIYSLPILFDPLPSQIECSRFDRTSPR